MIKETHAKSNGPNLFCQRMNVSFSWYRTESKELNICVSLPPCGGMCLLGKLSKFLQEENKHFRFENRQEKNESRKQYLIHNRISLFPSTLCT